MGDGAVQEEEQQWSDRVWLLTTFLVAVLLCLPALGRPFYSRGEPREALVAQGMLSTGDYVSPPAYDQTVPSKPPFMHWGIAVASRIAGAVSETTSRLPSAVASVVFVVGFALFLRRRVGIETASLASIILLSMFEWFRAATSCRVDGVLAAALAGSLLALYAWNESHRKGPPILAITLLTVATLTKGPIGFCLPGLIFAIWNVKRQDFAWRRMLWLAAQGVAIVVPVVVIAFSWYGLAYLERGDLFLEKIWSENVERLSGSMEDDPHDHSAPFLWGTTLLGLLPWSLVLPAMAVASWSSRRQSADARSPLESLAWITCIVHVALFSIPTSKRAVYLLAMYPFVAFLLAHYVQKHVSHRFVSGVLRCLEIGGHVIIVGGAVCAAIVLLLGFVVSEGPVGLLTQSFYESFSSVEYVVPTAVTVVGLLWLLRLYRTIPHSHLPYKAAFSLCLAFVSVNTFVVTGVVEGISIKRWLLTPGFFATVMPEREATIYSFSTENYAASFYLQTPFRRILESVPTEGLVFLEARHLEQLRARVPGRVQELQRYTPLFAGEKRAVVVGRIGP